MTTSYVTITDQFCGAGGSSLGASAAGAEVRLALNHWPLAIETHNANFPETDHDCTDVSACEPRRYRPTTMLITSPECTNHSLARGKRRKWERQLELFGKVELDPGEERSRATMWDVCRFAEAHRYRIVIVENVVEARQWEPFEAWLSAMHALGYKHKCVYLNSMHAHPTPQSRDRMYVVFWHKSLRDPDLDIRPSAWCAPCGKDVDSVQSWKNPLKPWGKYKQQYIYCCPDCAQEVTPYYYCAANIIDWSLPAPRIGDRKRALKDKTRQRIQRGLEKFGRAPQLVGNYTPGWSRPLSGPTGTITTADHHSLLTPPPFLMSVNHSTDRFRPLTDVMPTAMPQANPMLVCPPIVVKFRGNTGIHQPLSTITAAAINHGLAVPPFLTSYYGTDGGHAIDAALPTVPTHDRHALVVPPFIHSYYGRDHTSAGLDSALPTVPGRATHYLVSPGDLPSVDDCGFRMLEPHEIGAAMAFPATYRVLGNKRQRVKQFGNAVTPPAMELLVRACLAVLH